jgi:signal transduction histidine kinase
VASEAGVRSSVGSPISVDGHRWGLMFAASSRERLPPGTDARLSDLTDLLAIAIANAESRAELAASRARVVAAADETRRRIERDLHDGAQQRLVSLALELRAAESGVPPELRDLRARLSTTAKGLNDVVTDLQELSRGIHPAILSKGGLGPALKALARRSALPVELELQAADRRLPEQVEVATYYIVSEGLTNAAKHAQASVIRVDVSIDHPLLVLSIRDDGVGGADARRGSGLIGLKDRVETLGGTIEISGGLGHGTTIRACIPIDGKDERDA